MSLVDKATSAKFSKDKGGDRTILASGGEIYFEAGSKQTNAGTQAALGAAMTDNSGGAVSTTLAAVTAGVSYAQADIVALKNAVASLAAEVNAIISALKGVGVSS